MADGVQGSELAQRGHVHMHQMRVEEETKKLGERNNDLKAEQWREHGIVWTHLFVYLCVFSSLLG